ncbi:hypothetical protein C5612_25000 [Pseudomonas frederiksbergensis]|uniref:Uncharacterized protein n=1 Tax=Pseudomonas frederiksbergensis TaxID=104087 RepID=A0A2S8HAM7_9PSED|nr:hypothetical protein C5612_25000 [Pseudomonas frederiksbergensis]
MNIQRICCLAVRFREQARSHKESAMFCRFLAQSSKLPHVFRRVCFSCKLLWRPWRGWSTTSCGTC